MLKNSLCFYALLHLLLGFLAACGPNIDAPPDPSSLPTSGLFANSNCITGCWQGLRPGQTTSTELESFLRKSPSTSNFQITNYENGFVFYTGGDMSAVTSDSYLFSVELTGPYNLKLKDIINTLGIPDYVSIYYRTGSEVLFLEAFLEMYYPEEGFVLYSGYLGGLETNIAPNNTVNVCPEEDDVITRIQVLEPGTIEEILNNRDVLWTDPIPENQLTTAVNQLTQWPGFNCVNLP